MVQFFTKEVSLRLKLTIFLFIILFVFLVFIISAKPDGRLHLVFCDVGQGDAIFLKSPTGQDILIDGGPDKKVLDCLDSKMAFYDRTLELMALSHPQSDHLVGLIEVLKRVKVKNILITKATNDTPEFTAWQKAVKEEHAAVFDAKKGKLVDLGTGLKMEILWPPDPFYYRDINETSQVFRISYGNFCALLTGDATLNTWRSLSLSGELKDCFLLKVPHHGSRNNLDEMLLENIRPKMAVISVGRNNRFGHPHKEVIEKLRGKGIMVKRTDEDGTIEIVTDGRKWWLK